jgi:hypothetical protein
VADYLVASDFIVRMRFWSGIIQVEVAIFVNSFNVATCRIIGEGFQLEINKGGDD